MKLWHNDSMATLPFGALREVGTDVVGGYSLRSGGGGGPLHSGRRLQERHEIDVGRT